MTVLTGGVFMLKFLGDFFLTIIVISRDKMGITEAPKIVAKLSENL